MSEMRVMTGPKPSSNEVANLPEFVSVRITDTRANKGMVDISNIAPYQREVDHHDNRQ